MMTRTGWAALLVAILISAYSLAEAVATGLTGHPMLDPDAGPAVARGVVGLLLTGTFTLSVAVLQEQSVRIDAGSRPRRWLRRLLQADLGVCAAVGAVTVALIPIPGQRRHRRHPRCGRRGRLPPGVRPGRGPRPHHPGSSTRAARRRDLSRRHRRPGPDHHRDGCTPLPLDPHRLRRDRAVHRHRTPRPTPHQLGKTGPAQPRPAHLADAQPPSA